MAQERRPDHGQRLGRTPILTLSGVTTADAGGYDCVVSNTAGSATSPAAVLTVEKALAVVTLATLVFIYNGLPALQRSTPCPPASRPSSPTTAAPTRRDAAPTPW